MSARCSTSKHHINLNIEIEMDDEFYERCCHGDGSFDVHELLWVLHGGSIKQDKILKFSVTENGKEV